MAAPLLKNGAVVSLSGDHESLDHTESDQDCRGQKAPENSEMDDPLGYRHVLISLGSRNMTYSDRRYQ